jgi:hypothetical protein
MTLSRNTEALALGVTLLLTGWWTAASDQTHQTGHNSETQIQLQPIANQVRQLESLLNFLGQPLSQVEQQGINSAIANPDPDKAVEQVESILDKHALIVVSINPESHVSVTRGDADANLIQNGTRLFLVKIVNEAGITGPLKVDSPNSGPVFKSVSDSASRPAVPSLSAADIRDRWADISLLHGGTLAPLLPNDLDIQTRIDEKVAALRTPVSQLPDGLGVQDDPQLSGSQLEYRIMLIYSRDAGERSAELSFDIGKVTQNAGTTSIRFDVAPTPEIKLHVLDDNGQPTMASFIFQDAFDRIYPNPSKRLAPDFYFEPQVYRADGEYISLPPGSFTATFTGGPEYITETQKFMVSANGPHELSFHLKRWINPADHGWYSGDSHIHANGCAHYADPTLGVSPVDMDRQVRGEHLNVASVLNWGPDYYYQRQFFRGRQDNELSKPDALLHYDLEVSGFPSSPSGHPVLLNLADQDYPGAKQIEDWPSWELPIFRWAKSQGATVGFAHAGGGLALGDQTLPNYEIPPFDAPGANEYIVDVTYPNTVDFIDVGDGPFPYDLNIWYQTLNVGFRTRIAGETDFPCIYDTRVGMGRTYAKVDGGGLTYSKWLQAIRDGESYVSDGRSHLMDFMVNGTAIGTHGSEVDLPRPGEVEVQIKAAAYIDPIPDQKIRDASFEWEPYWNTERSRIGESRKVLVEVILNGDVVARQAIDAGGSVQTLKFNVSIDQSSWIAIRILPASHTNPIFVIVADKPIRASRRSAEWCLAAVEQCWSQKAPRISKRELFDAEKAYEHARQLYKTLIDESKVE